MSALHPDQVLAVVAVSDIERSHGWYERLFGQTATNRPMSGLAEWRMTESGWLQVFEDPQRAGRSLANFAVSDLDAAVADIASRGIEVGEVVTANRGVRLHTIADPDGNQITLIGNFREDY